MIKEWTLGECVSKVIDYRGKTPGKLGGDWTETGYRVISAMNVHGGSIDNEDQIRCVSKAIYDKWMQDEIQRYDCFLASEGASLGENAIWDSDEKVVLGQRLYAIRTNPNILDPWYFAMYMQTKKFRDQVDQVSTGSTVFGISQPILLSLKLLLPEIEDQRYIGQIYRSLKNKIANNTALCADLEAMAKLLYDYWFVQFDFPDGNGKPYKSSGGKMVWNEDLKREIPEEWEVKNITEICDIVDCLHSKKPEYCFEDDSYYLLTLENLTKDGHIDLSEKFYISKSDYETWTSKIEVCEGDFVVTNAGRAGDIGHIPKDVKCAIGRNLTAIRPKEIDSYYLNMFLHSYYVQSQITSSLDQGSFFTSFNVYAIKTLKVLIPDNRVMKLSLKRFADLVEYSERLIAENQQLNSLRDFLLPMLMNGQVKVSG